MQASSRDVWLILGILKLYSHPFKHLFSVFGGVHTQNRRDAPIGAFKPRI